MKPLPQTAPLSRSVLVYYGLPMAAYMMMSLPVSMWFMKYATDQLLIAPAVMGGLFAAGRVWDAISDPMAGYLSDRTRSAWGRRRSWLLVSAIPLGLSFVMLWAPPSWIEGKQAVFWVAAALLLWETTSTAFYIPYTALGLELSDDYHERTRIFGWRQMLMTFGFASALIFIFLMRTAENARETALWVSIGAGTLVAFVIALCALRTKEAKENQGRGGVGLLASFGDVFRNPHALMLFFVLGIESFGTGIVATLSAFIMDDVVGRVDLIEILLACWMLPQFLFVPLWIRYSKRLGKKKLWLFGMASVGSGFASLFFLAENAWPIVFAGILLIGIGTSISQVIGPSIQADVVDYDELHSGERKEGAYAAIWNFVRKAGTAGAAAVGGLALSLGGYDPMAEIQADSVKDAIRITVGVLPAMIFAIGMIVFSRFSLNEAEHAEAQASIRARNEE